MEWSRVEDTRKGRVRTGFLHHNASTAAAAAFRVAVLLVVLVLHAPADPASLRDVGAPC